jgi:peptide deformylase
MGIPSTPRGTLTGVPSQISTVDELRTGGTILPILRWGNPIMHRLTRRVTAFDDELLELVRNMFATMYAAEGVGLAATQVGADWAVFVYDCPDDDHVRHVGVMCNADITLPEGKERKLHASDEGCLSLPGAYMELARPDHAICRGLDQNGESVELVGTERHRVRRSAVRAGSQEALRVARGRSRPLSRGLAGETAG